PATTIAATPWRSSASTSGRPGPATRYHPNRVLALAPGGDSSPGPIRPILSHMGPLRSTTCMRVGQPVWAARVAARATLTGLVAALLFGVGSARAQVGSTLRADLDALVERVGMAAAAVLSQ